LIAPCPPLPPIPANDIASVALVIDKVAVLYARCAVNHAAVVNAYLAARDAAVAWNAGE